MALWIVRYQHNKDDVRYWREIVLANDNIATASDAAERAANQIGIDNHSDDGKIRMRVIGPIEADSTEFTVSSEIVATPESS